MVELDPLAQRHPRPGVEQWQNPRNGLVVVKLHYTADPRKRDPEWKAHASRNMHPRAWRREYEIDWASPEGSPVIPEYQDAKHCQAFTWDTTLRLLRWWDFGFVSPVVLFAQLTLFGQVRVRRELCPFNTPLNQLWPAALAVTRELGGEDFLLDPSLAYDVGGAAEDEIEQLDPHRPPVKRVFDAGDPAGENQTDLGASADYLSAMGVRLHTTRPGTEVSYANLRARFLRDVMDPNLGHPVPAILIHPDCKNLRAALQGAFCLSALPPYKPKKSHPEKDVVDALRYGEDNLGSLASARDRELTHLATRDVQPTRSYTPEVPR